MRALLIPVFATLAACGEPGACTQAVSSASVSYSFCQEVEHQSECPELESGDEGDEFRWGFTPGKSCKKLGYGFDCGGGVFEDVETECNLVE